MSDAVEDGFRKRYGRLFDTSRQVEGVACAICGGPVYEQLCQRHDRIIWLWCRYCMERSEPVPCPECHP